MESTGTAPVAVIHDPELVEPLHRLAAAAGVLVDVVTRADALPGRLTARPGVLVDPGAAHRLPASVGRPDRTLLITAREPDLEIWRLAAGLRTDSVAVLPREQQRVLDWLADVTDARGVAARTLAVVGGRGGAGASTLACCLARQAVRHRGHEVLLVDADGLGGGLELLLGCEESEGLRWRDVAGTRGRISPGSLAETLPRDDGVAVLSWARQDPWDISAATVREVLQAARRAADLVLIDLPRRLDAAAEPCLDVADTLLLVCPADVRGAAGTARVLDEVTGRCADVRLVVRTGGGSPIDPDSIAASLRLPLAGVWPSVRAVERAVSEGLGPPAGGRLGRAARRLLYDVLAESRAR